MQPEAAQAAGSAIQPAVNMAAEQKTQMAQTPGINGPKYTGEPISVNLKDVDLKDFFRLIHEISGLNVVLDPNVHGTLTVVLDDVPWDQALDIVLKNNGLARQLEGNVLRIATLDTLKKEADARRAQQESEALAVEKVTVTRFLSYAHSKDVVPTVKKFLTQRGDVMADERTIFPTWFRESIACSHSWTARLRKWKLKPGWWLQPAASLVISVRSLALGGATPLAR